MNHQPIIRHPDLSKMTERQLMNELQYLKFWAFEIWANIQNGLVVMSKGYSPLPIPIWKLHDDLQCTIDRQAAILEELNYRDIP